MHFGKPYRVNSGFRSPDLNKAVGGSKSSQHCLGQAVDFEIPGVSNWDLAGYIETSLDFDQLIREFMKAGDPTAGWVHCSYRAGDNRKQALVVG
jgi:zinc D-Ala-D-Ala carboxypeptidase